MEGRAGKVGNPGGKREPYKGPQPEPTHEQHVANAKMLIPEWLKDKLPSFQYYIKPRGNPSRFTSTGLLTMVWNKFKRTYPDKNREFLKAWYLPILRLCNHLRRQIMMIHYKENQSLVLNLFTSLAFLLDNGVERTLQDLHLDSELEKQFKEMLKASGWIKVAPQANAALQIAPIPDAQANAALQVAPIAVAQANPALQIAPAAPPVPMPNIIPPRLPQASANGGPRPVVQALQSKGYSGNTVLLGKGGFGFVYKDRHNNSGQLVAIKVVKYRTVNEKKTFDNEVIFMQILGVGNPFVLPLLRSWHEGELAFLVLPLMKMSLWDYLVKYGLAYPSDTGKPTALTEDQIRLGIIQILNALLYIHGLEIFHRDIKSDNILLDQFGNWLLSDYGTALKCRPSMESADRYGTLCCAPPECFTNRTVNPAKQDYYSVGVTAYNVLGNGDYPFVGYDSRVRFPVLNENATAREQELVAKCEKLAVLSQQRNEELKFPYEMSVNFGSACRLLQKVLHWNEKERADRLSILGSEWLRAVPLIERSANGHTRILKPAPQDDPELHLAEGASMQTPKLTGYPHLQ